MAKKIDLELVLLSERAVAEWHARAAAKALQLARQGIDPLSIPDEEAEILPDGSLRLFVPSTPGTTGRLLEMIVPPDEWVFRAPSN